MADRAVLAAELAQYAIHDPTSREPSSRTQISQMQHRINILTAWFGDLVAGQDALKDSKVVEIGCGQGDSTILLAWAVGRGGKVFAIDPAPLDYGAPYTLGEAQDYLTKSLLGPSIEWIQADPVEALQTTSSVSAAEYVVLAHSMLYMMNANYVSALFRAVAEAGMTRLLLAEWGMRASSEGAMAHLYAVQAQAAQPIHQGNVQMYIEPSRVVELARDAGWAVEGEVWLESPDLDDGKWEVAAARSMLNSSDVLEEARRLGRQMDQRMQEPVRCMDVWTCVLTRR